MTSEELLQKLISLGWNDADMMDFTFDIKSLGLTAAIRNYAKWADDEYHDYSGELLDDIGKCLLGLA